jgi:hypothetical protein
MMGELIINGGHSYGCRKGNPRIEKGNRKY